MTKEERIAAIEDKMDVLDDILCTTSDAFANLKEVGESKLQKEVLAFEEVLEERYDQLDEKRSELEE